MKHGSSVKPYQPGVKKNASLKGGGPTVPNTTGTAAAAAKVAKSAARGAK